MACTSITIVLELDETTDSPSGCARTQDGVSRDFHGWLGLTEAIDALVRANGAGAVVADGCDSSGPKVSPSRALDNPEARRKKA